MICKTLFCCLMSPSFVPYLLHIQVLELKWTENFLGKYSKAQQKKEEKESPGGCNRISKRDLGWEKKKTIFEESVFRVD